MNVFVRLILASTVAILSFVNQCWGHGFLISETDSAGVPVSLSPASQSQILDGASTVSAICQFVLG